MQNLYVPCGYCYLWSFDLAELPVRLEISLTILIAIAYCLISLILAYLLRKRAVVSVSDDDLRQINQQLEAQIKERQRAEASLRASEERWQLAIRGSNDGIWDRNIATNELFLSPRFKQMLGYEDDELENSRQSWIARIHPDERDQVLAANQTHITQKTPFYTAEYRLRCKDGRYRWFSDRAKAQCDRLGKAIRMTGSIRDITARKQAEFKLQQLNQALEARVEERTAAVTKSERRFRSLFESAPDFVYVLDCQGVIQQMNSTVAVQSGYTRTEMLGQSILSFSMAYADTDVHQIMDVLRTQGTYQQEMAFVCKDGQILTMDCAWTLIEDSSVGNYVLLQQRDITAQKQSEAERLHLLATLEESERRWQSFLEKVRLMVVGLDLKGRIDYVNPYFLESTGYKKEDILGSAWVASIVPKSQQHQAQQILEDILSHGDNLNYQNRLVTDSGEEYTISWNSTLLQDTEGQPIGTLSIGEDITERNAVDRMKNEFISVVSHELRSPLTSIHGALDLLHCGLVDSNSKKGKHVLSIAVDSSERLVRLVNDILELERLESGKIRLNRESVSTQEVVKKAYTALELMAERADVRLKMAVSDLPIWADRGRIVQVLINLVDNAIKFSETSSTVWITVEPTTDPTSAALESVRFAIKDQGRGIPPDQIHAVFERFRQVDASDSRLKGGTGLGLAICQSIVQQHGGDIWVESTLGSGSCFYFTVPKYCA